MVKSIAFVSFGTRKKVHFFSTLKPLRNCLDFSCMRNEMERKKNAAKFQKKKKYSFCRNSRNARLKTIRSTFEMSPQRVAHSCILIRSLHRTFRRSRVFKQKKKHSLLSHYFVFRRSIPTNMRQAKCLYVFKCTHSK